MPLLTFLIDTLTLRIGVLSVLSLLSKHGGRHSLLGASHVHKFMWNFSDKGITGWMLRYTLSPQSNSSVTLCVCVWWTGRLMLAAGGNDDFLLSFGSWRISGSNENFQQQRMNVSSVFNKPERAFYWKVPAVSHLECKVSIHQTDSNFSNM